MYKESGDGKFNLKWLYIVIIFCFLCSALIAGYLIGSAVQNNHQYEYYDPDNGGYDLKYIVLRFLLALVFPGLPISILIGLFLLPCLYMLFVPYKRFFKRK